MRRRQTRGSLVAAAVVLVAGVATTAFTGAAHADAPVISDGMPSQAWTDAISTDPMKSGTGQAGWGDLAGGVASRPYVSSLSITNGSDTTAVITDGTTAPITVDPGAVTAVVSPVNLCRVDQTPSPGRCYAMPNRVAVTIGYGNGGSVGRNFGAPSVPVTPTVDASSVIDMTIVLNTLGRNLRWTGLTGDLLSWQTTNLGQGDASVHVRFHPARSPYIAQWPAQNGCTATPIFNCSILRSDGEMLTASLLLSLDNTLDASLTGAVFATQNAIAGFLSPGGSAERPTLDIQAASTHLDVDGALRLGTVEAFLPAAALINLYGVLPSDAGSQFVATRSGDPGTNAAPTFTPWTAADNGSDGLFVKVDGVTFSVPRYKVAGKLPPTPTQARALGATTTVSASVAACTKKAPCRATVYDLGASTAARYGVSSTLVVSGRLATVAKLAVTASSSALRKGHRYLLVVRAASNNKLLASTVGVVK